MSYGNGIKLTAGFDVGAKTPLDSKSVVQTIVERDAFVTDNLVYEGLEVYVKDTGHKYRYNGTSWIDLDAQSGSESGTGEGLTTEQAQQLTTAYEHSQTPHVSADDIPTNISDLTNDSGFITSIPEEYITETELEAKGYLTSHQDISGLQPKTDDNLATTSKEVVGAINEVKSSNDTKLNKTDANKLNCVVIDNVSLKEYILTNFTVAEGKTYHLIAKTTCTDLPKASNFYITVETPGLYTYKVTAKELNDSNGSYVCTYRTTSSSWTAWQKVCTTTVADVEKTLITISDETNYKNSATCESFYIVKNGTCFVTLTLDCVSPSNDIAIGNLPSAYGVFRFSMACVDGVMNGYILPSGALKVSGGTANTKYYVISFSYPVAES